MTKIEFPYRVPRVQGTTPIGGCDHSTFCADRRLLFHLLLPQDVIPNGGYSHAICFSFGGGGYHSGIPILTPYSSTRSFLRRTMNIFSFDPNGGCYCSYSPFPNGDHSRRRLCSPLRLVPQEVLARISYSHRGLFRMDPVIISSPMQPPMAAGEWN